MIVVRLIIFMMQNLTPTCIYLSQPAIQSLVSVKDSGL